MTISRRMDKVLAELDVCTLDPQLKYYIEATATLLADEEKQVTPDQYRQEHGKCPTGYHFIDKKCVKIAETTHGTDKGTKTSRSWIPHHPAQPTYSEGGTAKKYGLDPETGIPSDPKRKKMHESILSSHLDHVESVPKDKAPIAIVTMGGPASGKSSALAQMGLEGRKDFVQVDPDAIKTGAKHLGTGGLPEFHEGVGAGEYEGAPVSAQSAAAVVHEESSALAKRMRKKAVADRKNVLIDGTGKDADAHINMIKDLQSKGYIVHLVMPHQSAEKAHELNKKRATKAGRYVPPEFVDDAYSKIPFNFHKVAAVADHATLLDATKGYPPKKVYEKDTQGERDLDTDFMSHFRKTFSSAKV